MTHPASIEKQRLIDAAIKRLTKQGIENRPNPSGTHTIVLGPDNQRIDLWPTTGKWMRQGQGVSLGMNVFWKAVSDWGVSDGA